MPFHGFALTQGLRFSAGSAGRHRRRSIDAYAPDVPAVRIILIRGVHHCGFVPRELDIFNVVISLCKQECAASIGGDGIEMIVAIVLRVENDSTTGSEFE